VKNSKKRRKEKREQKKKKSETQFGIMDDESSNQNKTSPKPPVLLLSSALNSKAILKTAVDLFCIPEGSSTISSFLKNARAKDVLELYDTIAPRLMDICSDKYGSYVMEKLIQYSVDASASSSDPSQAELKNIPAKIWNALEEHCVELSCHGFFNSFIYKYFNFL
jgi:hypothetical protein